MAVSNFQRFYGNMVWTNHAIERLQKRGISQADAIKVMQNPDKTFPGKSDGSVKFIRTLNGRKIHLIGSLNDQKQWVIVTAFVRGEEDKYGFPENLIYGFLGLIWKIIKYLFKLVWKKIVGR